MASSKPFQLEVDPDPCPALKLERGPSDEGVGEWVPNMKHTLLAKYIGAASATMNKWQERVFIDPFCGPGRIQVKGEADTRDGGSLVAFRQALKMRTSYTKVFIGDLNAESLAANDARLSALGAPVRTFAGKAEDTVHRMVRLVPKKALCLAYIDPYNLSLLNFDMIRALAALPNIDFAVHFSTMDLARNVEMESDEKRFRFDEVAPGWKNELAGVSKSGMRVAFLNYWTKLVCSLGFQFSKEMPLVNNHSGQEIYRLVFFARHDLPIRLWSDVAKDKDQRGFDF